MLFCCFCAIAGFFHLHCTLFFVFYAFIVRQQLAIFTFFPSSRWCICCCFRCFSSLSSTAFFADFSLLNANLNLGVGKFPALWKYLCCIMYLTIYLLVFTWLQYSFWLFASISFVTFILMQIFAFFLYSSFFLLKFDRWKYESWYKIYYCSLYKFIF